MAAEMSTATNLQSPEEQDARLNSLLEVQVSLRAQVEMLERRVRQSEERRRALIHIMSDLNDLNKRLSNRRKAMLYILGDYEKDRSRLARQAERLDNSRRALIHILQDAHQSNLRLADSRKAMIHMMSDLHETTLEMQRREQELREKQEQLVQAGKLATLGELTAGVAHELNNPLNNIALFVGNAIDLIQMESDDKTRLLFELNSAMQQVRKASDIISHLRTFGRVAPAGHQPVSLNEVLQQSVSLMQEQLRLHEIQIKLDLCPEEPITMGNSIQLEQVFVNLLTNACDAMQDAPEKLITITCAIREGLAELTFQDSGPGISEELAQRIFDPFFTTKEVGAGTGLGLSITYSIIKDHQGTIFLAKDRYGQGAVFVIQLPLAQDINEKINRL